MNAKALLVVCIAGTTFAAAANASLPTYTLNWLVNGQESVVVNEGDTVLVTGIASWNPAAHGYGSSLMRVELSSSDASDDYIHAEGMGLGRNPLFRMMPQSFTDNAIPGGWTITGVGNTPIDAAQLPQFINPFYTAANPVEVFRFQFIAGDAGRSIWIDSPIDSVNLFASATGMPTEPYMIDVHGAQIDIVPAPGAAALLGLGGLTCIGRRRRN